MSTNSYDEQNGRQPPKAPPSDVQRENVHELQKPICRQFVWGTCTKNVQCKFRHELDLHQMKEILKFCHDFQNKQGCSRLDCTYLHASQEEERLFRASGDLPRALTKRYAAMSDSANYQPNFEGMPQTQMMMFVTAPPPPPPPAPLLSAAPPPPPPAEPMPGFGSMPPHTTTAGSLPMFNGPLPSTSSGLFSMTQMHLPLPEGFDPSRPPPKDPPPSSCKNKRSLNPIQVSEVRRKLATLKIKAGPSKIRKEETSKLPDTLCENCVQRDLRIGFYKQQMYKLHCDEEYQTLVYKKKMEEYEHGRDILRALVGPELFRLLNEYIEETPQLQDILAQLRQNSFVPAPVLDDTTLLQSLLRRTGSIGRTTSPERLPSVSLGELLRNTSASQIEPVHEASGNERVNGFNRYMNGQKESSSGGSMGVGVVGRYPPVTSTATQPYAAAGSGPGGYVAAAPYPPGLGAPPPPGPAAPYPTGPGAGAQYPTFFPPGPPPPTRPYYSQQYSTSSTINPPFPNVGYSGGMNAPGSSQMSMRPPSSVASNYSEYMMPRYTHPPHYYPPFQ